MNGLTIYQDNYADSTVVSNLFIDEYMKDANDAQLKVYLYLIRMMDAHMTTSISDMADKFNHTEKDIMRALKYWEKNRLLSLEFDGNKNLTGIHLLDVARRTECESSSSSPAVPPDGRAVGVEVPVAAVPAKSTVNSDSSVSQKEEDAKADLYEKPIYSLDQLKEFKNNEETAQLLFVAEQYLGKPLSPSEIKTILFFSDRLHFSADLIDYLIQYCVERDKKSFNYIEKVAISWAEAGITTPKQAARSAHKYDKNVYAIMKALGKTSTPTDAEVTFINHWTKDLGFTQDIIFVACERTVLATEKHRFEYADSILTNWYKKGVQHAGDIQAVDEAYTKSRVANIQNKVSSTNKFNQFAQNTYDYEALEREILSN